jgi:hypothetical protein
MIEQTIKNFNNVLLLLYLGFSKKMNHENIIIRCIKLDGIEFCSNLIGVNNFVEKKAYN